MKINFHIVLTFLLAFSFGNAQSTTEPVKVEANSLISVYENNKQPTAQPTQANLKAVIPMDASVIKETIAHSSSDIRLYFNRLRNVDNLNLLFPKINQAENV